MLETTEKRTIGMDVLILLLILGKCDAILSLKIIRSVSDTVFQGRRGFVAAFNKLFIEPIRVSHRRCTTKVVVTLSENNPY